MKTANPSVSVSAVQPDWRACVQRYNWGSEVNGKTRTSTMVAPTAPNRAAPAVCATISGGRRTMSVECSQTKRSFLVDSGADISTGGLHGQ